MVEVLQGVKSLYNDDNFTHLELITNYRKIRCRLPYTKIQLYNKDSGIYTYKYTINIQQYCKYMNINCYKYLYLKDV